MNIADFLTQEHVEFDLLPHRDTFDAQRMAQSLHISGRHVAKTVLLRVDNGREFVVALLPANNSIDLESASELLDSDTVELATEHEVSEQCPDCEIGALPPFGSLYGMKTIVDSQLAEDVEIVFEGNTHHESIRMTFDDFRQIEEPQIGNFTFTV